MPLDPALARLLLETFGVELEEQTQAISEGLLALEKGVVGAERSKNLDAMFRAAHNIKGAARGVDVTAVSAISHTLETLFSGLRRDQSTLSTATISLCLQSLDRMREAFVAFEAGQDVAFDLPTLLAQLDRADGSAAATPLPQDNADTAPATQATATESATPSAPANKEGYEVARVGLRKLDQVSALTEGLQATKIEMHDHLTAIQGLHDDLRAFARKLGKSSPVLAANTALPIDPLSIKRLLSRTETVHKQMRASNNRLNQISDTLQDELRTMRLVPASTVLQPLARSVRDIAVELGKQVDYVVSGDSIEVDRPILDGIKDPLMHLMRNAVDHGIESPQQRLIARKPPAGQIKVNVSAQGGRTIITIADDGAGIHVGEIAAAAVKKKLLTAAEVAALTPDETLDLIFRPGFSSKGMITNVSGRGVGLDVVLTNLRKLKGSVHVTTEPGTGTTFTISLPQSLSTDRGLMVRSGGALFAIPSLAVERVMDIDVLDLLDVEARQAVVVAGKAVPAHELSAVLGLPSVTVMQKRLSVVVIAKGWQRVALLVDDIVGEREIVIKRFKPPLLSVRNVAGGTLTGSGEVVMVLNPSDLVDSALQSTATNRIAGMRQNQGPVVARRVLVVDDSITTRTLERNILESQGFLVTIAVDGKQGWEALHKESFDLVVTDVEMPQMNGFELTEQIKGSDKFRDIPVIIVTSLGSESDRRRGVEVGADAYVVKGQFETGALLEIVNQLI